MNILITIVGVLFIFFSGAYFATLLGKLILKKEKEKKLSNVKSVFNEVLENLKSGNSKFKNRFGSVAYISTHLKKEGQVDIVYMLHKNSISLFKGEKCIYNSDDIKKQTVTKIINELEDNHGEDIHNVVNFLGVIYSKPDIEKMLGVKWEDFQSTLNKNLSMSRGDSNIIIDNDSFSNEFQFDIDDILDKIGRFGINSLTIEERKYLDDYSRS